MKFYELYILKKLGKDAVAVSRWNRKTVEKFKQAKYVSSLGAAKKGPLKGKEGVVIQQKGIEYKEKLEQELKETRRYWISISVAILSGVIVFVLGKLFP